MSNQVGYWRVDFTKFFKHDRVLQYFSHTFFCKSSVKLTFSLKIYAVRQFDEKNFQVKENFCSHHSVEICTFFPTMFCKNSVKLTFSLKSYTVNQFDEKFLQWGKFPKLPHCAHTSLCNFCEFLQFNFKENFSAWSYLCVFFQRVQCSL